MAASSPPDASEPWNNKGQRAAIGQSSGASRVQLYVTMGLFLWIMREQWQMVRRERGRMQLQGGEGGGGCTIISTAWPLPVSAALV